MDGRDQIGAVVHSDDRIVADGGFDMFEKSFAVFILYSVHRNTEIAHQRSGHIVLGRQGIGGAKQDVGTAGFQRPY